MVGNTSTLWTQTSRKISESGEMVSSTSTSPASSNRKLTFHAQRLFLRFKDRFMLRHEVSLALSRQ
jgi:hypothetical protein